MSVRRWILPLGAALAVGLVVVLALLTILGEPDGPGAGLRGPDPAPEPPTVDPSIRRPESERERRAGPRSSEGDADRTVSGTVVLAGGRPLQGVRVEALVDGEPTATATTDALGRFEVRGPTGRWIRIRASGTSADGVHVLPGDGTSARAGARDVEVRVKRGAPIEGRVFGPDGRAMPNVEVFVGWSAGNFRPSGKPVRTDGEGRFRQVVHPHPGTTWRLVARVESADDTGMPFALGRSGPVKAGARDVRIDLRPGEEIRGQVESPDGLPVARVPLKATLRTLPVFRSLARTDGWGRFVIRGFHPGFYRISLDTDRHEGGPQILLGGEHVRSGRTDVRLSLREAGTISGRLLLASGEPAMGRTFHLRHETEGRQREVLSDSDGRFVVTDLPRGTYVATAWSPAGPVELCRVATGDENVVIQLPR